MLKTIRITSFSNPHIIKVSDIIGYIWNIELAKTEILIEKGSKTLRIPIDQELWELEEQFNNG